MGEGQKCKSCALAGTGKFTRIVTALQFDQSALA